MTAHRVVVVGAGIVGASIAYHLAARGVAVTLVDKDLPGRGVTSRAFAWINVAFGQPVDYAKLRQLALGEYRRLQAELGPALQIDWCGALSWYGDPARTERMAHEHASWGYDVRLLDRAGIATLEPGLVSPPDCAMHSPGEGALDPLATTQLLAAAARDAGAEVRTGTVVTGIATAGDRVSGVRTADGTIPADTVVLAAGADAAGLCAPLGVALPVARSPAILMRLRSSRRLVRGIVAGPELEVRHITDTGLLAVEDHGDESPENGPQAIARRAVETIRRSLRGAEGITLEDVAVGIRPMPADDRPIVGFGAGVGGLYLAVMHAGIILAPTVGRLAAGEILDGAEAEALAPCRMARFAAVQA